MISTDSLDALCSFDGAVKEGDDRVASKSNLEFGRNREDSTDEEQPPDAAQNDI